MMKMNSELRRQAADSLSGNWGPAVLVTLFFGLLTGGGSRYSMGIINLILLPVVYGYTVMFLDLIRGVKIEFGRLFDGYKDIGRIFGTVLLHNIYIVLWSFLLIIPGIIKAYSYAMTNFILKDYPELAYNAAIEKSMAMMSGYKMKLFLLDLSFIGWAILSCLTLGIGFLFLAPYMQASHAAFYEDLRMELGERIEVITE